MFIKYQKIRNTILGTATVAIGGVGAFFGFYPRDNANKLPTSDPPAIVVPSDEPSTELYSTAVLPVTTVPEQPSPVPPASQPAQVRSETSGSPPVARPMTDQERYIAAMKFALGTADASGKGKDVLGAAHPWKLNLYDDDKDGHYDRGKLDTNRDEVDDEKWNFKNGRWEKDGGAVVWSQSEWIRGSAVANSIAPPATDADLSRYRAAFKIATARADRSGKGKDVLGSSSPWKLNLYDDDKDGTWDRAKLDKNRDEVDDEKWNFKEGRWERAGGGEVWDGENWK